MVDLLSVDSGGSWEDSGRMGFRWRTADFAALVDGAFDETGEWFVDVTLVHREMRDPVSRRNLIDEAKRAMILGVIEETRRGRSLGAKKVRVAERPRIRCAGKNDLRAS